MPANSFPTRSQQRRVAPSGPGRLILNRGIIAETGVIPDGYHLIRDSYVFNVQGTKKVMAEDINGKQIQVMRVQGLFQEGEKPNANGRVYPRDVLAEATKILQEDIGRRSVYGEFDHPQDAKIHLDRIAHLVTKAWMDGNKIYGQAEILDNQPFGACLRGLFERKCQVGISSRGVGDMEMRESAGKQHYYVLPGYQFVTWDAVAEPSVHGANLNVMEALRRKVKPVVESQDRDRRAAASGSAAGRRGLLPREVYEEQLVAAVNEFFGLKPLNEAKRTVRRRYTFGS
jgi:hypothetical protein